MAERWPAATRGFLVRSRSAADHGRHDLQASIYSYSSARAAGAALLWSLDTQAAGLLALILLSSSVVRQRLTTAINRAAGTGDRVGLVARRGTAPVLIQAYRRDMGGGVFVTMKDISAPTMVHGRRRGGLSIGYRAQTTQLGATGGRAA